MTYHDDNHASVVNEKSFHDIGRSRDCNLALESPTLMVRLSFFIVSSCPHNAAKSLFDVFCRLKAFPNRKHAKACQILQLAARRSLLECSETTHGIDWHNAVAKA